MILTADLHLKPESASAVFDVLRTVRDLAKKTDGRAAVLGDLWHVRYSVPVDLLNAFDAFLDEEPDVLWTLLPGNHDQIDVAGQHAMQVFSRPNVVVQAVPCEDETGLWLPYRKDIQQYGDVIQKSGARFAFVHHGLQGARMNSGIVAGELDGVPPSWFQKFQNAFFGHWHLHQQVQNCVYVGSPYQTRSDEHGQAKGVIDLDLTSGAWKFVPLDVGAKFIDAPTPEALAKAVVRPGDVVKLPHGVAQALVDDLVKRGAEVRIAAPVVQTSPRFGLGDNATMRDYAAAYIAKERGDLDPAKLLTIFDETMSS